MLASSGRVEGKMRRKRRRRRRRRIMMMMRLRMVRMI
jgi:hypothetical protein